MTRARCDTGAARRINRALFMLCGAALSALSGAVPCAVAAPIAYNQNVSLKSGQEASIDLVYGGTTVPRQELVFTIHSSTYRGTLESHEQRTGLPYPGRYYYRAPDDFAGPDGFTWKVHDGSAESNIGSVSISVLNTAPVAENQHVTAPVNRTTKIQLAFYDPDDQPIAISVVTEPTRGHVEIFGDFAYYTPDPGYEGQDAFAWEAFDGVVASSPATCSIAVSSDIASERGHVILAVNHLLLPEIIAEVERLKQDLTHEGHEVRIAPWNTAEQNADDLWTHLNAVYTQEGLTGALLIGHMPKARNSLNQSHTDLVFWNMQTFRDPRTRHIWVSRIQALGGDGAELYAGDEVSLIRRALAVNHAYRTGQSRLPHDAFHYDAVGNGGSVANALAVWPVAETRAPHLAWTRGGDLLHQTTHGTEWSYDHNLVHATTLLQTLAQVRSALITSCASGVLGGVANHQLFTRRGGNVLSIGASEITYTGAYVILDDSDADQNFRAALAAGSSWGQALVDHYAFVANINYYKPFFHGDLSLPVMAGPPNRMPAVSAFSADTVAGPAPLAATFTVEAHDPDGALARYEWFPEGYGYGKIDPPLSASHSARVTHIYERPQRYRARVQVEDNRGAVAYREIEIRVGPAGDQPLRVNCGRVLLPFHPLQDGHCAPDLNTVDSQGRVWLHDQKHVSGVWGRTVVNESVFGYRIGPLHGTDDPDLFRHFARGGIYRIDIPDGSYIVRLGFADMDNTEPGQRLMDIALNGVAWETGFDIVAATGPNTAYFIEKRVVVENNRLDIRLTRNADSPDTPLGEPILNCFEIIPDPAEQLPTDNDPGKRAFRDNGDPILYLLSPSDPVSEAGRQLEFFARVGHMYRVEYIDDLMDAFGWRTLVHAGATSDVWMRVPDAQHAPRRFYRIVPLHEP